MFFAILIYLVLLFVIEVVLGSSTDVYNAEIGFAANCNEVNHLSPKQFFTRLLPFIALFVLLPLIILSGL